MLTSVSFGLTARYRKATGWDFVDTNSRTYKAGEMVGAAVDVGLPVANPCSAGALASTGLKLINGIQAVGNTFEETAAPAISAGPGGGQHLISSNNVTKAAGQQIVVKGAPQCLVSNNRTDGGK